MRITDLIVDPVSFGKKYWLVEVVPYYEYRNGNRTDNILGHSYVVVLPEKEFEKIHVKIEGQKIMESPDGHIEVSFEGLEPNIHWSRNGFAVGAKAKGIKVKDTKS